MAALSEMSSLRRWSTVALLLAVVAPRVRAADDPAFTISAGVDTSRRTAQERPFAFSVDPSTPSAGVWTAGYTFGIGSGISADRPLPANLASASGSSTFTLALGATDRIAPFASATFADEGTSSRVHGLSAGVTWQVTRPIARLRASISAAALHEGVSGANGATLILAASQDQGPLRVVANVRADKVFAAGRDAIDYLVTAGAAWRLGEALRLGVEYVGQDLEESFVGAAEGGARHALGPTLAMDLDGGRYQVTLGSGFGLTARSPRAMARAVFGFSF